MTRTNRRGVTLLEIMMVIAVFSLAAVSLAKGIARFMVMQEADNLRQRAQERCQSMISEMKQLSLNSLNNSDDTVLFSAYVKLRNDATLSAYDDGGTRKLFLSLSQSYFPESPPSSNKGLRMERLVKITKVPDQDAWKCVVTIYKTGTDEVLAQSSIVLRSNYSSPKSIQAPTYLFLNPSVMSPVLNSNASASLISHNSMLSTHRGVIGNRDEIRTLAFGRDRFYRPYGWIQANPSYGIYVYDEQSTNYPGSGMLYNTDTVTGSSPTSDIFRTHATEFNHAQRYPQELLSYDALKVYESTAPDRYAESIRILMEKMIQGSTAYKHRVLLFPPGGLMPAPPLRNFSDAAKNPATQPNMRAVVHPENLRIASGQAANLRVYTYPMMPSVFAATAAIPAVTVLVKYPVSTAGVTVRYMVGSSTTAYSWIDAVNGAHYTISSSAAGLKIVLYNSPLHCGLHAVSGTGLDPSRWLHGLEYIPCVVGTAGLPYAFVEGNKDLSTAGAGASKNTARWVIGLPAGALPDGEHTIETRLGNQTATGAIPNDPENLSTTYLWVGVTPPRTEQFQLVGDPRHMPYADVKSNHGYNRYYVQVPAGDYEGFSYTWTGWSTTNPVYNSGSTSAGLVSLDVPRAMQLWREALLNSNAVFSFSGDPKEGMTPSYISMGGEISGAGLLEGNIWISTIPSGWYRTASEYMNSTVGAAYGRQQTHQRVIAKANNSWVSRPDLGELCPDSNFASWKIIGNLSRGAATQFYRAKYSVFYSTLGFSAPVDFDKKVAGYGLGLLLNGNASGAGDNFAYQTYNTANVPLTETAEGQEMANAFKLPKISSGGASILSIDHTGTPPTGYDLPEYAANRNRLTLETWLSHPSGPAVGLVKVQDPTNVNRVGWVVVNGARGYEFQLRNNAQFLIPGAGALWAFYRAGEPAVAAGARAVHFPLVRWVTPDGITAYKNPSTISLDWAVDWKRFDNKPYNNQYPDPYAPADSPLFNITYHKEVPPSAARTYFHAGGVFIRDYVLDYFEPPDFPADPVYARTSPYTWDVSALPAGSYQVVVRAFFPGRRMYSSDTMKVVIDR
ncbi:MAG: type II secretion system protein [Elusimicrobia bacterium]|nr:type II secretion system protein [Elusimicrobiota bacterium]